MTGVCVPATSKLGRVLLYITQEHQANTRNCREEVRVLTTFVLGKMLFGKDKEG